MDDILKGNWKGSFKYEKGYRKFNSKVVEFEMSLEQNGLKFTGTATDKKGIALNPDPAFVSGHFENYEISFVKQYPSSHTIDKQGNLIYDKSIHGPLIYFEGIYDPKTNKFEGTWILSQKMYILGLFPKKFVGRGSWEMKKQMSK